MDPSTSTDPAPAAHRRLWLLVKIVEVRLRFVAILLALGLFIGYWDTIKNYWDRWTRPAVHVAQLDADHEFFCPMHPKVVRQTYEPNGDVPKCPICGMPLSQRVKGAAAELPAGVTARVQLSPERVQLAGVETVAVGYRPVSQPIITVGDVVYDESRLSQVTSWVAGYVQKLYVDKTYEVVKEGQALAEIYSPEYFGAAEELLLVARRTGVTDLLASARQRLNLLGVADADIDAILAAGTVGPRLVVRAPRSGYVIAKPIVIGSRAEKGMTLMEVADLSVVWIEADVYEKDIARLKAGQPITATVEAWPGRTFAGTVALIYPRVDPLTRTNRVRFEVANATGQLRPGMYATVRIDVPPTPPAGSAVRLVSHPSPDAPAKPEYLTVPQRAVIDTGTRQVVYVERSPGLFEGVEVQLGPRSGEFYPVWSGLKPDDRVAAAGAFLIDAETRLNPDAAATYFGASGGPQASARGSAGGATAVAAKETPKETPKEADQAPPAKSAEALAVAGLKPATFVRPNAQQLANIAKLPEADRVAAEKQATCPVTGLALGAMGRPIKITVEGQEVFLCCKGCAADARQNAKEVLRRVAEFKEN